jgi:RNA polymerase sigma-70 factor (ECF subfamily)
MELPGGPEPIVRPDEGAGLAALRAGDEAAFLRLVRRHHASMLRVAAAYVRSRAVAEEVAQDAWLGVLRGLDSFEGRGSLRAWIFGIVANRAKSRAARELRTVPLSALDGRGDDGGPAVSPDRFRGEDDEWAGHWAAPPEPWPDDRVQSGELLALVRAGLERLPPAQRAVMSMRDVAGMESAEVCEALGISEANQRVLLHRARSRVRAFAEERLGREEP